MNYKNFKIFGFLLTLISFISCTSSKDVERNLSEKEVFTKGFPKTLSFRNDRYGLDEDYENWEENYLKVNSITKKYLQEEVDIEPVFAEWANKFAKKHPEKLMLLHLNGEGISIKSKEVHEKYFPGHWVYEEGTFLKEDIEKDQNIIRVESAKAFSDSAYVIHRNAGILGRLPHNVILVEIDEAGNKLWNESEYATIETIDYDKNIITVKRGEYFSTPRNFKKGKTYIAPLAGDHWGGNLMWYYNLSSTCPRDENGKTASDVFLEQIKTWFGKNGVLKNLDGIGYDVNYFTPKHKNWDTNNDGIADQGFVGGKNVWREGDWRFLKELRKAFGTEFIITADGWLDEMQRAVGILNGMETEGLARPNDGYRQISRTINQHTYWNKYNDTKYKFSYITSKLNHPADGEISTQLRRMGIALATNLEVAYTVNPMEMLPEATGGSLNKPNWLGHPVSELIYTGKETPDLLNGNGIEMNGKLLDQFDFSEVNYRVDGKTLYIKGKGKDPYEELEIKGPGIDLPEGDLIIFLEAKAIEGFKDFDTDDRVPRKINIKIDSSPNSTLPGENPRTLAFHNELAGFMGTPGYTPLGFYFRNVGNTKGPIKLTIEVEEQGEFAIRNLTVHNASSTLAREFDNGVVLVNPSYNEYEFDLKNLFPDIKNYRRLRAEKPGSGEIDENFQEVLKYNNGERIIDASKIRVPGLNALFLIKD